jgi:hypothetical protein
MGLTQSVLALQKSSPDMSALGHLLLIRSALNTADVRCCSKSDHSGVALQHVAKGH